jgi:hypothetical protein
VAFLGRKPSTTTPAPLRRPSRIRSKVCGRTSGVSPKITRTSSGIRVMAPRAASTAWAVPRRSDCTKILASGSTRLASVATASLSGPTTTAVAVAPASETAASTWASNDRPAILCNTFGRAERMRVPSPAASTMARQVRSLTNGRPPGRVGRRRPHIRARRRGKGGMREQNPGKATPRA